MFFIQIYRSLPGWAWLLIAALAVFSLVVLITTLIRCWYKHRKLARLTSLAGFAYDPEQDIFYSEMDAWQRQFGYCHLYDEGAPLLNMIIDCEPIHFRYRGKRWLIELWKGQYGITTRAEIGVYYTRWPVFGRKMASHAFYRCVKDKDMLPMAIRLKKNDRVLFDRCERHWWLTGFVLGEFSEPADLRAICCITFPNAGMRCAFTKALQKLGYRSNHFTVDCLTVRVVFTKPLSKQPHTRTPERVREVQKTNRTLVALWNNLTRGADGALNKLNTVRDADPKLYNAAATLSKSAPQYLSGKRFVRKAGRR